VRHTIRTFEVKPDAPADPPVALGDRHVEADTLEEARAGATGLFTTERRPVRSLSFLADGGLVAYVLPELPEPVEPEKPRRRRRRPGGKR
jgi:hypothetical protein